MEFNPNGLNLNLRRKAGDVKFGGAGFNWRFEAGKKKLAVAKSRSRIF